MRFDCLDASYQLIRELRPGLVAIRREDSRLHTQLCTAASSVALNIAEGRGRAGKDRKHLWRVAHGSAEEVSAILEVALAFGYVREDVLVDARATLVRIHQMLWRMTR